MRDEKVLKVEGITILEEGLPEGPNPEIILCCRLALMPVNV